MAAFAAISFAALRYAKFVSDKMMNHILKKAGIFKATKRVRKIVAIQVRIVVPRIGFCKGVLMRKRIVSGPQILMPESMIKVPASSHEKPFEQVAILINRNGVFASPGSANEYIGRRLDDERKEPPKSFAEKIKKELTSMIGRLWNSTLLE